MMPTPHACPGCAVALPDEHLPPSDRCNASGECWQKYGELALYTTTRDPVWFIHQTAVDAYGAQHVGPPGKPIGTYFSLMGLYLQIERGYTGRQVQLAHVAVGRRRSAWPTFERPPSVGSLTVVDVLNVPAGNERDAHLHAWAGSVWMAWSSEHDAVRAQTERALREAVIR